MKRLLSITTLLVPFFLQFQSLFGQNLGTEIHLLYDNTGPPIEWISGKDLVGLAGLGPSTAPQQGIKVVGTLINQGLVNPILTVEYDPATDGPEVGWNTFIYARLLDIIGLQNERAHHRWRDLRTPINEHVRRLQASTAEQKILVIASSMIHCTTQFCLNEEVLDGQIFGHSLPVLLEHERLVDEDCEGIQIIILLPAKPSKRPDYERQLVGHWLWLFRKRNGKVNVVRTL